MTRRSPGVARRRFLAGAAAAGGALLVGRPLGAAPESAAEGCQLFGLALHGSTVYGAATLADGRAGFLAFGLGEGPGPLPPIADGGLLATGTGPGQFNFPLALAPLGDEGLLVVDANNGRLQILDWPGAGRPFTHRRDLGRLGPRPGEVHRPSGAAAANGVVYVADTRNHRVQLLDLVTGAVLKVVGERGTAPGTFRVPSAVALDEEGLVYVADSGNGRVQVLSAWSRGRGADVDEATRPALGGFTLPLTALVAGGGSLFVLESASVPGRGARIHAFRREGTSWRRDEDQGARLTGGLARLRGPHGMCRTTDGSILVGDRITGVVHRI